jgi:hypothetical protein
VSNSLMPFTKHSIASLADAGSGSIAKVKQERRWAPIPPASVCATFGVVMSCRLTPVRTEG